ncbi:hypothetical protein N9T65_01065 [Candidatus Pelagibacter sp.]|nr:hypothetical protein [Candidatus Pelagibacter sp.]
MATLKKKEGILPKTLKPDYEYDLIRIGKNNDGGYLVSENSIMDSEILVSAGIALDVSFEHQYINLTKNNVKCFDHTINLKEYTFLWLVILLKRIVTFTSLFEIKNAIKRLDKAIKFKKFIKDKKVNYYKIGLGVGNNNTTTLDNTGLGSWQKYTMTLDTIISKFTENKKIFCKIDIEGHEYRLLDDLIHHSNKISGLVIEFHDVDLHLDKIINFKKKIDLTLVHTHINNAGPIVEKKPSIIELSFGKNPKNVGDLKNTKHLLDQPNLIELEDIELKFE